MSLPFNLAFSGLSSGLQTKNAAASGGVGGWVELGRTTLGSAGLNIDVTSLTNKRYYMILHNSVGQGGSNDHLLRFNGDTGSNYAYRTSATGAADDTLPSNNYALFGVHPGSTTPSFTVSYVANYSTKEKLVIGHTGAQSTAGAGTAPYRSEEVSKWANTSNAISSINIYHTSENFNTGSEVIVLAWDPADTHTNNFWTELYSGDLSAGAAAYIDSGTITAKKYLWVQLYTQQSVDSDYLVTFNGDNAGTTYARRYMNDGATETTGTSLANFTLVSRPANLPSFHNFFIINNSAKEKLIISHQVNQGNAGSGTAPTRTEYVGKWANTAAQITSMRITSGSGNLATKTILKIWGSD